MRGTQSEQQFELSDALWERLQALVPEGKSHARGGRPNLTQRVVANAIFFVLRTGCQWKALSVRGQGCSGSSAHRYFQAWEQAGVFSRFWALGLQNYDELRGIDWEWMSMDGAMTKAPLGGEKNRSQPDRQG